MTISIFQAISFYSPLIILISIFLFSIFSSAILKGFFYIFWLSIITAIRMLIIWGTTKNNHPREVLEICNTGILLPYTNLTYSTYILCFTLFYFVTPMILIGKQSSINYTMILFFIAYIIFDLFIKISTRCVPTKITNDISWASIFADLVSGIGMGSLISGLLYGTSLREKLFINEVNSNNEVCTAPSKQQFKCSVYKNGELVK
jgi:hypothetical protein